MGVKSCERNLARRSLGSETAVVEDDRNDSALARAVQALSAVKSLEDLLGLLRAQPWLTSDATLRELDGLAGAPEFGLAVARYRDLLAEARPDPEGAWARFSAWVDESERAAGKLEAVIARVEVLSATQRWDEAIQLASAHLVVAEEHGQAITVGFLRKVIGSALLQTPSGNRAENVEVALPLLESAAQLAPYPSGRAEVLVDLALAHSLRVRGDPRENIERGCELLTAVLETFDLSKEPRTRTTAQTNLAHLLQKREEGDRLENLREAAHHCLDALEWRSADRDLGDWAFTVLNLASTRELLSSLGEGEPGDARAAYEEVIAHDAEVRPRWLAAHAHAGLARMLEQSARQDADAVDQALMAQARAHLETALRFVGENEHRLLWGRIMIHYARILASSGDRSEALKVARQAMNALPPTFAPADSQEAAGQAGELLSQAGAWGEAAEAYCIGVAAGGLRLRQRLSLADRRAEISRIGNAARWASFAMLKAGDSDRAVRLLEAGRARELSERARLDEPGTATVVQGPIMLGPPPSAPDSLTSPPARGLDELLDQIRSISGLEDFEIAAEAPDIAGGVEPGWPLVYINPAPAGTAIFVVTRTEEDIGVKALVLEHPTSTELIHALLVGLFPDSPGPHSYIGAAAGVVEGYGVEYTLDHLLPWLGVNLAAVLAEILSRLSISAATLIVSGALASAPLHAAPWFEGGSEVCLLDKVTLRLAPSASLQGISIERAARASARPRRLVGLGNPTGAGLPASEAEVREVSAAFPSGMAAIAFGDQATVRFLVSHAPVATHIHFACHGRGSPLGFGQSAIKLADGEILAEQVPHLGSEPLRLTVLSACQTAISSAEIIEEAFSVSTALLAAGSASVIASLWSVDDYATALLMTRFYERLLKGKGATPAEALRDAQLWMRGLTALDEGAYLEKHAALKQAFRVRLSAGNTPGRRSDGAAGNVTGYPYNHPYYWAGFVVTGS